MIKITTEEAPPKTKIKTKTPPKTEIVDEYTCRCGYTYDSHISKCAKCKRPTNITWNDSITDDNIDYIKSKMLNFTYQNATDSKQTFILWLILKELEKLNARVSKSG